MKRERYRRGRHFGRIEVDEPGRICQLLRYLIDRLVDRVADLIIEVLDHDHVVIFAVLHSWYYLTL